MSDSSTLARALAARGYHVFPARVKYGANGKKTVKPTVKWEVASTTIDAMIRTWWEMHPDAWVCIDTGKSGIVVVDTDGNEGGANWHSLNPDPTRHALPTTTGGRHYYYRADPTRPIRNSQSEIGRGVDVRGVGGMVIVHPDAMESAMVLPEPSALETIPTCVGLAKGEVAAPPLAPSDNPFATPARVFDDEQAQKFITRYAKEPLTSAPRGQINARLNNAATVVSHFIPEFLSEENATRYLIEWQRDAWVASGGEDDGDYEAALATIRSGLNQGRDAWKATRVSRETPEPTEPLRPSNLLLPEEFWNARPVLQHIRRHAYAHRAPADTVLHCVLARMAAAVPPTLRVRSWDSASLNYFVIPVGPPGTGKTRSARVAGMLFPAEHIIDGVPPGSGEGLAELFYGTVTVEEDGKSAKSVRGIEHHNVLLYMDEGEQLARMMERVGATIGGTMRSAWVGAALGQANASAERRRFIPADTYALAAILGFQETTIGPILDDDGSGTVQRMLFCWTVDPNIPRRTPKLDEEIQLPNVGHAASWEFTEMQLPESAVEELEDAEYLRLTKGIGDKLDNHRGLHLMKISALLALLDCRTEVTEADWRLAHIVWETSCAVRQYCLDFVAGERAKAARARRESAAATAVAQHEAIQDAEDRTVDVVARNIARRIHTKGDMNIGPLRTALLSRQRPYFQQALDKAIDAGWVVTEQTERTVVVKPGASKPAE